MARNVVLVLFLAAYAQSVCAKPVNIDHIVLSAARAGADLASLLQDISLEPVNDSKRTDLMRVKNIASGSVYEQHGIEVDDIVITKTLTSSSDEILQSDFDKNFIRY